MKDPVALLYEKYPFDPEKILASSLGDAYVAIMLANGQIGVCSTLQNKVETDPLLLVRPDFKKIDHRILIMAYANANINYTIGTPATGDIFDQVDFAKKQQTVMVGYFPPLVEKFRQDKLPLFAFDEHKDYPDLTPMLEMKDKIEQADCVILTSTSLINFTFSNVLSLITPGCEVLMLGPSTPLDRSFKEDYQLKGLFGMTFNPYDFEIMEIISQGLGTPSFSKKGKKVSL